MKYLNQCLIASTLLASSSLSAAVISVDWQNTGDNLITRDTVSKLDWLDLTESNNMTFATVQSQLGAGRLFDGFRFATDAEVVGLWANYDIDLSVGAPTRSPQYSQLDQGIYQAGLDLGNLQQESGRSSYPYGTSGMTETLLYPGRRSLIGAFFYTGTMTNNYYGVDYFSTDETNASVTVGSYLVKASPVSAVPVPAAVWLFGSGLLGLVSVARRKARS